MAPAERRLLIAVGQYHPDHPAGANRIAYDEARFLAAAGAEVWMLVQDVSGNGPEHEVDRGIHVLRYRTRRMHILDPRRLWAHQRAIESVLSRHKPAIKTIHGHAPLEYSSASASYPAARKVYSIHSPVTMEMKLNWADGSSLNLLRCGVGLPLLKRLEHRCIDQSDAVTVFSRYTRGMLENIHGTATAKKVSVIPGWVDFESFNGRESKTAARRVLDWPEDVPVLFTLRRLVGRMGLDVLLRAAAQVRKAGHDFRLMIGGDGPLRSFLEETAAALELDGCVSFLGRVADDVLPAMYSACDAFVLPTSALECFGLIAIEALAAGRPVLATPIGAIPEILAQVEPRWLARSAEEGDLVSLLTDFFSGELPVRTPTELRTIVEREYRIENVIPRLTPLLFPHQEA